MPQLPEGWAWATLDAICPVFVDCAHRTPKYHSVGFPALRPRDVVHGRLDLKNAGLVPDDEYRKQTQRREPQAGDVVYSRELSYGWATVVPEKVRLCLAQGMVLFRLSEQLSTPYIVFCLNGPVGRGQAENAAVGTAHPHINLDRIKSYSLPIPPIQEQHRIVTKLESLLSVVDALEIGVTANLRRAERLRQSIIRLAFEGRLVSQNVHGQPASVLFKHLRAERAMRQQVQGKRQS